VKLSRNPKPVPEIRTVPGLNLITESEGSYSPGPGVVGFAGDAMIPRKDICGASFPIRDP
jgi:hypothetical protein